VHASSWNILPTPRLAAPTARTRGTRQDVPPKQLPADCCPWRSAPAANPPQRAWQHQQRARSSNGVHRAKAVQHRHVLGAAGAAGGAAALHLAHHSAHLA
jgi:hypothetical protein